MNISIALATYNGARYLEAQLDSFVRQTRMPDELVVSDDCSVDDTLQVIDTFAAKAPFPVHLHRNRTNFGYAANFQSALEQCSGDLVFLSDQDDVWFPEKIELIEALAESDKHNMVFMNDAEITDEALHTTGLTKLGQLRSGGIPDSRFVMGCCAAIRKEFFDLCLPVPAAYGTHDGWIVTIADGIGRRRIIERPLQWYRRHASNESQMPANRLRSLTKVGYLWGRAVANHQNETVQSIATALEKTRMLRERLQSLALDARHKEALWRPALLEYLNALQLTEEATEQRLAICARPRWARLWPAFNMYMDGQYNHFSGAKALWRDVLFK